MIKYIVDSIFVNIDIYIVKKKEEGTQCSPMCPATVGQHHDVENVDDVNRI